MADGFGRNYLLPRKLAMEATAANKAVIDQMKQSALRRSAREKGEAEQLVAHYDALALEFTRKVGENEQLFGSVTSSDIAQQLEAQGLATDRRKITLAEPLRQLGEFLVRSSCTVRSRRTSRSSSRATPKRRSRTSMCTFPFGTH